MRPTAKSLILDLLSTLRGGAMPVRALVEAAALFGIDGNAVRVALTRLVAAGRVESDERGSYRLGPGAAAIAEHVASWRTLDRRTRPWKGGWLGAETSGVARSERRARRATEHALGLLGFRALAPDLFVRPDNLSEDLSTTRRRLETLGLDPRTILFPIGALDDDAHRRARSLWSAERIEARYRREQTALERSLARLERLPVDAAMAESFLVGGKAIRTLVTDPLLPAPIVDETLRRDLLETMRAYDARGRACWAEFMRTHGAPYKRTPHHLGGGADAAAANALA